VAYENQINLAHFMKNSQMLVENFNERKYLEMIGEVNDLKRSLQSNYRIEVERPVQVPEDLSPQVADLEERFRNIVCPGPVPSMEPNPEMTLNEGQNQAPSLEFVANLLHNPASLSVPSNDRNGFAPPHTLPEIISPHIMPNTHHIDFNPADDFGVIEDPAEVARLGLLSGNKGIQILNSIRNRKELGSVSQHLPATGDTDAQNDVEMPAAADEQPQDQLMAIPQDQQLPTPAGEQVTANDSSIFSSRHEQFRDAINQLDRPKKPPRRNRRRVASDDSQVDEAEFCKGFKIRQVKPPKNHRRARIRGISSIMACPQIDFMTEIEIAEKNTQAVPAQQQQSAPDHTEIVAHDQQLQGPVQMEMEPQWSVPEERPQMPAQLIPIEEESFQHHLPNGNASTPMAPCRDSKRADITPPSNQPSLKRVRAEDPIDEAISAINPTIPDIIISAPGVDGPPSITNAPTPIPKQAMPNIQVSRDDFLDLSLQLIRHENPNGTPAAIAKDTSRPQFSKEDAVLEVLASVDRREEEKRRELNINTETSQNMREPTVVPHVTERPKKTREELVQEPVVEQEVDGFPVQIVIEEGIKYYEFYDEVAKKTVRETQYDYDTFCLYMQVRALMNKHCGKDPWKMSVKDLINKYGISMKSCKKPRVIEFRLMRLAQIGYFIPTYTAKGDGLLEIEIPLDRRVTASSEKENAP
jgi:hypothetical protein